jgi:hypothetical protein
MSPRLFTIALALLAFSDVAFGRIGKSEPNVFASRPVGHSPEFKARTPEGRSRSLSKHGKLDLIAEKLQPNARESVWQKLKETDHFGAWGPEKNHDGIDLGKAEREKKKRPGKLRKLRAEESDEKVKHSVLDLDIPGRRLEESEDTVVRDDLVREFQFLFLP